MKLLWPKAMSSWKAETVGDILESLMGIEWLCIHDKLDWPAFFPSAFEHVLHDWCIAVYRFHMETAWRHDTIDGLRLCIVVT